MRPNPKSPRSSFRGINLWVYGYNAVKQLPETIGSLEGLSPDLFKMTRWQPLTTADKRLTQNLRERLLGWCPTSDPKIVYGLERWGDLNPNDGSKYMEWFSIAVIHPLLTNSVEALKICEGAGGGVIYAPADEYG
jgi:hypothetical protein